MSISRRILSPFDELEPSFLSEAELQERFDAFRAGSHSLEHAADCGLLGLTIPTRFGGLYTDSSLWHPRLYTHTSLSDSIERTIIHHLKACQYIVWKGTPTQCDVYLPQLAAGKRIATWTENAVNGRYDPTDGTLRLWGRPRTGSIPVQGGLIGLKIFPGYGFFPKGGEGFAGMRYAIISFDVLPEGTAVRRSRMIYTFRQIEIPATAVLGIHLPDGNRDPEKWEAIRWRTDRSGS